MTEIDNGGRNLVSPPTDTQTTIPTQPRVVESSPKQRRKVLTSSFLGSMVEYYDFLLYGAAAGLVFLTYSSMTP